MYVSTLAHACARVQIQRLFLGQTWINLPAIKTKICEETAVGTAAPPCAAGLAAAPIGLPSIPATVVPVGDAAAAKDGRRCVDCQEVVADLHFVARRMQLGVCTLAC